MSTIKTTHLQHPSASSPNLTLAADGSVSGGAGLGGLVHIATESFSGQSMVSFDNVFSATYLNYRIMVVAQPGSSNTLNMRMRNSGSDVTSTTYTYLRVGGNGSTASSASASSQSSWAIEPISNTQQRVVLDLFSPFDSSQNTRYLNMSVAGSIAFINLQSGVHSTLSADDGFSIIKASAFDGEISVYGYANS